MSKKMNCEVYFHDGDNPVCRVIHGNAQYALAFQRMRRINKIPTDNLTDKVRDLLNKLLKAVDPNGAKYDGFKIKINNGMTWKVGKQEYPLPKIDPDEFQEIRFELEGAFDTWK